MAEEPTDVMREHNYIRNWLWLVLEYELPERTREAGWPRWANRQIERAEGEVKLSEIERQQLTNMLMQLRLCDAVEIRHGCDGAESGPYAEKVLGKGCSALLMRLVDALLKPFGY